MRTLSIDQGTTSTRGIVFAPGEAPELVFSAEHQQIYPQQGWVEHDPEEILGNIRACIERAGPVDAIGIANQGESCLAWDRYTGEALSPLIVWQDNRTDGAIASMKAAGAEDLVLSRSGLPLESYFSAAKLSWILQNVDAVKIALEEGRLCLGSTDAFFLQRLTGRASTDVTTASRTQLMNLETCQWDSDLCRLFRVPMACLPAIRSTAGDFGTVGRTPVLTSVVDQQASLFGHRHLSNSSCKITFGTGAFVMAATGATLLRGSSSGLLPTAAWRIDQGPVEYALEGGIYNAGAALQWAKNIGLFADYSELSGFDQEPAISANLAFVPAFSGLAAPHWDRSAAAMWLGMSLGTSRQQLQQSMLEGIAFRAAQVVGEMDAHLLGTSGVSIDGGISANEYLVRFLADVLQLPVHVPHYKEVTALGVACLVAVSQGCDPERLVPPGETTYLPSRPAHVVAAWRDRYARAVEACRGWLA